MDAGGHVEDRELRGRARRIVEMRRAQQTRARELAREQRARARSGERARSRRRRRRARAARRPPSRARRSSGAGRGRPGESRTRRPRGRAARAARGQRRCAVRRQRRVDGARDRRRTRPAPAYGGGSTVRRARRNRCPASDCARSPPAARRCRSAPAGTARRPVRIVVARRARRARAAPASAARAASTATARRRADAPRRGNGREPRSLAPDRVVERRRRRRTDCRRGHRRSRSPSAGTAGSVAGGRRLRAPQRARAADRASAARRGTCIGSRRAPLSISSLTRAARAGASPSATARAPAGTGRPRAPAASSGVSCVRSRHCQQPRRSRARTSRMLLRWTSVGCAVSTGLTSAWPNHSGDGVGRHPPSRELRHASATLAALRRRTRERVRAAAPVLVDVLGDVGEVREVAERAHDVERLADRQTVQQSRRARLRGTRKARSRHARKRIAVCRIRSIRSKPASPVCARSTSPNRRPSSRVSSRSGRSLSTGTCAFIGDFGSGASGGAMEGGNDASIGAPGNRPPPHPALRNRSCTPTSIPNPPLHEAARRLRSARLADLFAADPGRAAAMTFRWGSWHVDISKERLDAKALGQLLHFAAQANLGHWIAALFVGEKLNLSEQRPALHPALRAPDDESIVVDGIDVMTEIRATRGRMATLVASLRDRQRLGATGKALTCVVQHRHRRLGPRPAALLRRPRRSRRDGSGFAGGRVRVERRSRHLTRTLAGCDAATTLFIVTSKTFTTQETLANARSAREWLAKKLGAGHDLSTHFVAVTTNIGAARAFGVRDEDILPMSEGVGGRYSLWSAVGGSRSRCGSGGALRRNARRGPCDGPAFQARALCAQPARDPRASRVLEHALAGSSAAAGRPLRRRRWPDFPRISSNSSSKATARA